MVITKLGVQQLSLNSENELLLEQLEVLFKDLTKSRAVNRKIPLAYHTEAYEASFLGLYLQPRIKPWS